MRYLIERLEKARGPDRELDARIYCATRGLTFTGLSERGIRFEPMPDSVGAPVHTMRTETPYTESIDAARSLLPWKDHPGATFTSKTIQSGYGNFYHFVEFTWPSTERQGRAYTEALATCICALLAIEETERQIVPFRRSVTTGIKT